MLSVSKKLEYVEISVGIEYIFNGESCKKMAFDMNHKILPMALKLVGI